MELRRLQALGNVVYSQSLHPVRRPDKRLSGLVLGYDCEYDSETRELICVQLSYQGKTTLVPVDRLDWTSLYAIVVKFLRSCGVNPTWKKVPVIRLISYFSLAEAQHLDTLHPSIRVDQWGSGNYDFAWPAVESRYYRCPVCHSRAESESGKCLCGYAGRYEVRVQTRQSLQIIDLQTWYRGMPLGQVAKTFGLTKLDYDRAHISRECLKDPEFVRYACNDAVLCESIYNRLRDTFWTDYQVDIARTRTPANTSMRIFRRHYLTQDCDQRDTMLRRLVLQCSWGGNNQAFARGVFEGRYSEWDARSMYPNSAIALGVLPTGDSWYQCRTLMELLDDRNVGGVCEVLFDFGNDCQYPCLPVMVEGALCYPRRGRSYCTLAELRLAHRMGARMTLVRGYAYREGIDDLSRYLRELMLRKDAASESGDIVRRTLYKLMANSIIGKFAQKVVGYDLADLRKFAARYGVPLADLMRMRNLESVGIKKRVNLGSGWYPEWQCLILGYARSVLAEAFADNPGRVMAGTTDSLILAGDSMNHTHIRGIDFELKAVGSLLAIVRTRFYVLMDGEDVKHLAYHGMRRADEALKVLLGGSWQGAYAYRARHLVKYREAARRGVPFGQEEYHDYHVNLGWDGKRRLVSCGPGQYYSIPLDTCELARDGVD